MNRLRTLAIASSLAMLSVAFLPSARADEWNKKTILTVNEPLAIPGKVLQPGKYVMKLMDSQADRHIVQVFNGDESQLETTILAIPNYRLEPTGKTQFGFWETPAGQPRALKAWFYPGDNFGQEFAYPKEMATTLAQVNKENVPTVEGEGNNAQISETTPSGENQSMSACNCTTPNNTQNNKAEQQQPQTSETQPVTPQNTQPNPAPEQPQQSAQTTQPAPPPEHNPDMTAQNQAPANNPPAPAENRLPRTASPFPLLGLAGLISFAAALAVRAIAKQVA